MTKLQLDLDPLDVPNQIVLRPDFIISDSHWFHENIVKYQSRPFDHDFIMLKRWRATVRPGHTVLHLGDLFFGKKKGLERFTNEIAPKLTGHKYIILGNHDQRSTDYEALGFTVLKPYQITYRGFQVSFDHYPRLLHDNERRIHVHGHIHMNPYSDGSLTRPNNINVSVEAINYQPQRLTALLNAAISARTGHKEYYNSKSFRQAQSKRARQLSHQLP